MTNIDKSSLDQAVRPQRSGFLAALGGPQFIIAQLFTILATVLGVYLAGYVGFQRTLEYDGLVKARQQANLLTSLHTELEDNTKRLRAHVPALEATQEGQGIYGDWPRLYQFVWRASAESPVLFDVPPELLTGMQTFYENMTLMLNDDSAKENFRRLTTTNAYFRNEFTKTFDNYLKGAETELLPALKERAAAANEIARDYSD